MDPDILNPENYFDTSLSDIEFINLVIMLITIIPTYQFYRKYKATRIKDLQYFSLIFFATSMTALGSLGAGVTNWLIFYQIQQWSLIGIYTILYSISARIIWPKSPKILKYFSYTLASFLSLIVLLWKKMDQPEFAKVLFWEVRYRPNYAYPNGAGFEFNDSIILSSAHTLLADFYYTYCLVFFMIAYIRVTPANPTSRIAKARKLWLIAGALNIFWSISILPWVPNFDEINLVIIFVLFIIIYIVITLPEGMLMSTNQILRAFELFEILEEEHSKQKMEKLGMDALLDYIDSLPIELITPSR